jgi:hypothetical protein
MSKTIGSPLVGIPTAIGLVPNARWLLPLGATILLEPQKIILMKPFREILSA